jgi:glutathionyl-hydroquinone reductase
VTVLCCHGLFPRPYTRHCRWHIKEHYYGSHPTINPFGIVPVGHTDDLAAPHGRDTRSY